MSSVKSDLIRSWAKTSDGLEIYYESVGSGKPVVFQSGYMGIHDIWINQVKALSKNFRCITHDNRGYGMSSDPTDVSYYSMEKNADDLKCILDTLGITEPVMIVTHSIGGTVAIAFAMKYPQLVKGILLTGGPVLTKKMMDKIGGTPDMWSKYQKTPTERRDFYVNIGLCEEIAYEASKWNCKAFTLQTNALLDFNPEYDEIKEKVKQPVWLLHSKDDKIITEMIVSEFVENIPQLKYILKEGYNHFPPTEVPQLVVDTFLEMASQLNY